MLMKMAFPSTIELDGFIGQLQHFGKTQTQIVFSTPVEPRGLNVEALEEKEESIKIWQPGMLYRMYNISDCRVLFSQLFDRSGGYHRFAV